jgi:hypothetical protein
VDCPRKRKCGTTADRTLVNPDSSRSRNMGASLGGGAGG